MFLGPFNAQQAIPSASGSFGGIAVGPGPNGGKVIVTYQSPTGGQGPATIFANVDTDGLGPGGFGSQITVTSTNVGGFDFIPAQNGRSIDAEAGLVWDATGGPFNNRIYLVYTDETVNENNDTDIVMRTSTDDGATWSAAGTRERRRDHEQPVLALRCSGSHNRHCGSGVSRLSQ